MGKVFRTTIFGGFKKKDVVIYLENLNQEHRSEQRRLEEHIIQLKGQIFELTRQATGAERTAAGLKLDLEAASAAAVEITGRESLLKARLESLEEENRRLGSLLRELQAENQALSSQVLDFSDERRGLEADKERLLAEAQERQNELEARIFDLEAEVLEGLDHKADAWAGKAATPVEKPAASEADARKGDGRLGTVRDILMHVKRK